MPTLLADTKIRIIVGSEIWSFKIVKSGSCTTAMGHVNNSHEKHTYRNHHVSYCYEIQLLMKITKQYYNTSFPHAFTLKILPCF